MASGSERSEHERLLQWIRCPDCHGSLSKTTADRLECRSCGRMTPVIDGVPRFTGDNSRTAQNFGYIWGLQEQSVRPPTVVKAYHLQVMQQATGAPPPRGLVLDAGCGDGVDLAMLALDPQCEVVGVELSSGGVATTAARTRGLARAHVMQADLLNIPIADETFDVAYSYGVVHHTPDPMRAMREIGRTLKPGARALFYVYEDFSDRSWCWRRALALANSARVITTRLPPSILMALCRAISPIVFAVCTLPARRFRWAARFPYRHSSHPFSLTGDLYDRLSAPIEERYSRQQAVALVEGAGLEVLRIEQVRGWVIYARKPAAHPD